MSILVGPLAQAGDACSYDEAIMALQRGNDVRGLALMRMAARDGDTRAHRFLTHNGQEIKGLIVMASRREPVMVSREVPESGIQSISGDQPGN